MRGTGRQQARGQWGGPAAAPAADGGTDDGTKVAAVAAHGAHALRTHQVRKLTPSLEDVYDDLDWGTSQSSGSPKDFEIGRSPAQRSAIDTASLSFLQDRRQLQDAQQLPHGEVEAFMGDEVEGSTQIHLSQTRGAATTSRAPMEMLPDWPKQPQQKEQDHLQEQRQHQQAESLQEETGWLQQPRVEQKKFQEQLLQRRMLEQEWQARVDRQQQLLEKQRLQQQLHEQQWQHTQRLEQLRLQEQRMEQERLERHLQQEQQQLDQQELYWAEQQRQKTLHLQEQRAQQEKLDQQQQQLEEQRRQQEQQRIRIELDRLERQHSQQKLLQEQRNAQRREQQLQLQQHEQRSHDERFEEHQQFQKYQHISEGLGLGSLGMMAASIDSYGNGKFGSPSKPAELDAFAADWQASPVPTIVSPRKYMHSSLIAKPIGDWDEDDVATWLLRFSTVPDDLLGELRAHAITGTVLLSLSEEDLMNLGIRKFGHRRLLLLGARELRAVVSGKMSPQSYSPSNGLVGLPSAGLLAVGQPGLQQQFQLPRMALPQLAAPLAPLAPRYAGSLVLPLALPAPPQVSVSSSLLAPTGPMQIRPCAPRLTPAWVTSPRTMLSGSASAQSLHPVLDLTPGTPPGQQLTGGGLSFVVSPAKPRCRLSERGALSQRSWSPSQRY